MTHADLEVVYEALALQLDKIPEDQSSLYLAKLALLLSNKFSDAVPVLEAIDAAAHSLDA